MKALINYLSESTQELKQVTWPKQEDLIQYTIMVVVFVGVTATLLGILDFSFSRTYQWFLTLSL